MNALELMIFILVVVFGTIFLSRYLQRSGAAVPPISDDTRMLAEEVARLRDRIQVLERVITDNHGSLDLDRQIDKVAQARTELQKADTHMLLEIRKQLTPEQLSKLDAAQ